MEKYTVSLPYLWIHYTWFWPSCSQKNHKFKNEKKFQKQGFTFPCTQNTAQRRWRSSRSAPCYHRLCLNHCAICCMLPCLSFCEHMSPKKQMPP
jgi:hypothetical protein